VTQGKDPNTLRTDEPFARQSEELPERKAMSLANANVAAPVNAAPQSTHIEQSQ
jgi:hypothetical protein